MPFPFDSRPVEQLDALTDGMHQLVEFFQQHPNLPNPWSMSPLGASIYFHSAAADTLRKEFGREGWTQERCHIWRMVGPVRLELSLPMQQPQPFVL